MSRLNTAHYGLFSSPNTNAIMSSVQPRQFGIASGTVSTMRILGMMFSMMVTTVLFSLKMNGKEITAGDSQSFLFVMHTSFSLFVAFCIMGIGFSAVRGSLNGKKPETV